MLIPALGALLIVSCLVFFMLFNFGFDGFQNRRGIASEGNEAASEVDALIIKKLSNVLNGRKASHSIAPTKEEQFLFGFLRGSYQPFKVQGAIQSLLLKDGQYKLVFETLDQKRELVHKFKRIYLKESDGLADPVEARSMASEQLSYSILRGSVITGRLDIRFSKNHELLEIRVNRL